MAKGACVITFKPPTQIQIQLLDAIKEAGGLSPLDISFLKGGTGTICARRLHHNHILRLVQTRQGQRYQLTTKGEKILEAALAMNAALALDGNQ